MSIKVLHFLMRYAIMNCKVFVKGCVFMTLCESCVYFDYDEEYEENVCTINLDEDEYVRFSQSKGKQCPYYKFYDEYKSVQKQI